MIAMQMASQPMVLMSGAMMAAMMLPSIAPNVWRYRRHLRAMHAPHAGRRTMAFTAGYAGLWTAIGLAVSALPASRLAPWAAGVVVLGAGAIQRTRWKAKQLLRCREACVATHGEQSNVTTVWLAGWRLGIDCCLSCAAPMAVLFVGGLMDARMMTVIAAAITAERVAPAGARIARLTGGLAVIAGVVMCVQ